MLKVFPFQMLLSVILSVLGFAGGAYCVVISSLGLIGGPLCDTGNGEYLYPFRNDTLKWVWLTGSPNFAFPDPSPIFLKWTWIFPKWTDGSPWVHLNSHFSVACSSWPSLWPRKHMTNTCELWLPRESKDNVCLLCHNNLFNDQELSLLYLLLRSKAKIFSESLKLTLATMLFKPELEIMNGLGWDATAGMENVETHFKTITDISL